MPYTVTVRPSQSMHGILRVDDKENTILSKVFVHEALATEGWDNILSDEIAVSQNETSGVGAAAMHSGLNNFRRFMDRNQALQFIAGTDDKTKAKFMTAYDKGSSTEMHDAIRKTHLSQRMVKFGLVTIAAQSASQSVRDVLTELEATDLATTEEGRIKAVNAAYAIGKGILHGENAMLEYGAAGGIDFSDVSTDADRRIAAMAEALVSDQGFDGIMQAQGQMTLVRDEGLLGALEHNLLGAYQALVGMQNADPFLFTRRLQRSGEGTYSVVSQWMETHATEDLTKEFTSGALRYIGLSFVAGTTPGAFFSRFLVGQDEGYTRHLRLAMINEAASRGNYGRVGAIGGTVANIAGNVSEMLILSALAAKLGGATAGGAAAAGSKAAQGMQALSKMLSSKSTVAVLMGAKTVGRAINESGSGFAVSRRVTDSRVWTTAAMDTGTYWLSSSIPGFVSSQVEAPFAARAFTKYYTGGQAGKFYLTLALSNTLSHLTDIGVDLAIDHAAHGLVELAYGSRPFLPSREEFSGHTHADGSMKSMEELGSQFIHQVARRGAMRFTSKVIRQTIQSPFRAIKGAPPAHSNKWMSRAWAGEMDKHFDNEGKWARQLYKISGGVFDGGRYTELNYLANMHSPHKGHAALIELIGGQADPRNARKAYTALWKMQEYEANDVSRLLGSAYYRITGRGGIGDYNERTRMAYFNDMGARADEAYKFLKEAAVLRVETKEQAENVVNSLTQFVTAGTAEGMASRFRQVGTMITAGSAIVQSEALRDEGSIQSNFMVAIRRELGNMVRSGQNVEQASAMIRDLDSHTVPLGKSGTPSEKVSYEDLINHLHSDSRISDEMIGIPLTEETRRKIGTEMRGLAEQYSKYRDIQKKHIDEDLKYITETLPTLDPDSVEFRRLSTIKNRIENRQAYLDIGDGSDQKDGINLVIDFFDGIAGKVEDPELLDHKLSLSGSTTSDIVGAAQAYTKIQLESMKEFLKAGAAGDEWINIKDKVASLDVNQAAKFISEHVLPTNKVLSAFYENMDAELRRNVKVLYGNIFEGIYSANHLKDIMDTEIGKGLSKGLERFERIDSMIADNRAIMAQLVTVGKISDQLTTARVVLGSSDEVSSYLALALVGEIEDSRIRIVNQDGNRQRINDLATIAMHLDNKNISDDRAMALSREFIQTAVTKYLMHELIFNNSSNASPEENIDRAILATNRKIAEQFRVELEDIPVKVESVKLPSANDPNQVPEITLNTSNVPKDARSARRSIGYTHSLIDASQEGLRSSQEIITRHLNDRPMIPIVDDSGREVMTAIADLADRAKKEAPLIVSVAQVQLAAHTYGNDRLNIEAAANAVLGELYQTKFGETLLKMNAADRQAFAQYMLRESMLATHIGQTVSYDSYGRQILRLDKVTASTLYFDSNSTIVQTAPLTKEQALDMKNNGFIDIALSGAPNQQVWIKFSADFSEMKQDVIIDSFIKELQLYLSEEPTIPVPDDGTPLGGNFTFWAIQNLEDLKAELNRGTLPKGHKEFTDKLIEALGKGYNQSVSVDRHRTEFPDHELDILDAEGNVIERIAFSELTEDYVRGRSQAVQVALRTVNENIDYSELVIYEIGELLTEIESMARRTGETQDFTDALTASSQNLTDALTGFESVTIAEDLTRSFREAVSNIDWDNIAETQSRLVRLQEHVRGTMARLEEDRARRVSEINRDFMLEQSYIDSASPQTMLEFIGGIIEQRYAGQNVSVDRTMALDRPQIEAYRMDTVNKMIADAAVREQDRLDIDAYKSTDPNRTLANAMAAVLTRGLAFDFDHASMAKRWSGLLTNRRVSESEAGAIYERLTQDNARIVLRSTGDGEDGESLASPYFVRYFNHVLGTNTNGSVKTVSKDGGMYKQHYVARESMYDEETNTHYIDVNPTTFKHGYWAGVHFMNTLSESRDGVELDRNQFERFMRAQYLHADTYSRIKKSANSLQLAGTIAEKARVTMFIDVLRESATPTGSVRDNAYQFFRALNTLNDHDIFVATASSAPSRLSDNSARMINEEFYNRKFTVVAGREGEYLPSTSNIGINLLATMAEERARQIGGNNDIRDLVREVRESYNGFTNMTNERLQTISTELLDFVSKEHSRLGNSIIKTTVEGETVYMMGVYRSPHVVEDASFVPIRGVLNILEGDSLQVSNFKQWLSGGDFDGDLSLGLSPVDIKKLAIEIGNYYLGKDHGRSEGELVSNLGENILLANKKAAEHSILVNKFSSGRPQDTYAATPKNGYMASNALSGVVGRIQILQSLASAIYHGEITVNNTAKAELLNASLQSSRAEGVLQVSQERVLGDAWLAGEIKDTLNRLVFFTNTKEESLNIGRTELLGGKAIGSSGLVNIITDRNRGEDYIITKGRDDNYNIYLAQDDDNKIGAKRIIGAFDVELTGTPEQVIARAVDFVNARITASTPSKPSMFSQTIYATMPEALLSSVNNALVNTKSAGADRVSKVYSNINEFVSDAENFALELYAASTVDVFGASVVGADAIKFVSSDVRYHYPDDDRTAFNDSVNAKFTGGLSAATKEVLRNNLRTMQDIQKMMTPDNDISLSRQRELLRSVKGGAESKWLPVNYRVFAHIMDGEWKQAYETADLFSNMRYMNSSTAMFQRFINSDMGNSALMNKTKLDLHTDIDRVMTTSNMLVERIGANGIDEFEAKLRTLGGQYLTIDSRYTSFDDLGAIVSDIMQKELNSSMTAGQIKDALEIMGITWVSGEKGYVTADRVRIGGLDTYDKLMTDVTLSKQRVPILIDDKTGKGLSVYDFAEKLYSFDTMKMLDANPDKASSVQTVIRALNIAMKNESKFGFMMAASGLTRDIASTIRGAVKSGDIGVGEDRRIKLEAILHEDTEAESVEEQFTIKKSWEKAIQGSRLNLFNEADFREAVDAYYFREGDC